MYPTPITAPPPQRSECDPGGRQSPAPAPRAAPRLRRGPPTPTCPPGDCSSPTPPPHAGQQWGCCPTAVRSPRSVPIFTGAPASGGRGRHESWSARPRAHILAAIAYLLLRGAHLRAPHPQSCHSHASKPHCTEQRPPPQAATWPHPGHCREPCPGGWATSRDLGPLSSCEHHTHSAPKNQTTLKGWNLLLPGHPE